MTLVVGLRSNDSGYPIMMGDLLLSVSDFPTNVTVPTKDSSLILPAGSGEVPFALRQKLAIISDDLVIGWAGNASSAGGLVKDLREKNQHEHFTIESLKSYLESLVNLGDVSFTGFIKEGERIQSFNVNCKAVSNSLGEMSMIGSGAESVEKYLQALTMEPTAGNPLTQTILTMLGLSGSLLSSEIRTGFSLGKLFGAGYEIATVVQGVFTKIDDITYLFWDAWTDGDRVQIQHPNRSIKISYRGDILAIRVDAITRLGERLSFDTSQFFVSPVDRYVDSDEVNGYLPRSINSKFMCNYFAFRDQQGKETILTDASYLGSEEPSTVKFIEEGWQAKQFGLAEGYLDQIADRIRAAHQH